MMIDVRCNYCDTPAKIRDEYIYMKCHCCDDRRILPLKTYLLDDGLDEYLYSMINDDFLETSTTYSV